MKSKDFWDEGRFYDGRSTLFDRSKVRALNTNTSSSKANLINLTVIRLSVNLSMARNQRVFTRHLLLWRTCTTRTNRDFFRVVNFYLLFRRPSYHTHLPYTPDKFTFITLTRSIIRKKNSFSKQFSVSYFRKLHIILQLVIISEFQSGSGYNTSSMITSLVNS